MNQKQLERSYRIAILITLVVCMYLTGVFNALMIVHVLPTSFQAVVKSFFIRESLVVYPVLVIIASIIGAYAIHKSWVESQRSDFLGRNFLYAEDSEAYGKSHFELPYEYINAAQIRSIERCRGKILGMLDTDDDDGGDCIDFAPDGRGNQHIIVFGTSGGGKSFTFVKPYMFQSVKQRHSLVITDPDGGLYRSMAGYFKDNGYVVRKLDLKNLQKSDGWDCMKTLRTGDLESNVKIFAETIISNTTGENNIYSQGSNSLLSALIMYVMLSEKIPEEEKNIGKVYSLLQDPKGMAALENIFSDELMTEKERPAMKPWLAFKQASDNLRGNILTHLANGLALFQNQLLCDILSTDDMDMTLPGLKPCVYFCCFPDLHKTYQFIISLFFSMFFIELCNYADDYGKGGRLPVTVDFLLDEFYSIGIIPSWVEKISVVRKRGINCVMILQDLGQLQERFPETWTTVAGNCFATMTIGCNDPEKTGAWLSKRIGDTTKEIESTSESESKSVLGLSSGSRVSTGLGKGSLLSADEICTLDRDHGIILFSTHNPIYVKRTPVTLFPDYEKCYDINNNEIADFSDRPARDALHRAEAAYQKEYWQTHPLDTGMDKYTLTDAKYTEEPRSPIVSMLHVVIGDIKRVCKFISSLPGINSVCEAAGKGWNTFLKKNTWVAGMLPHKAEKSKKLYAPNPIVETAEMHAFERFRIEYAQKDELFRSNRFVERSTGEVVDTSIPVPDIGLLTKVEDSWADDDDEDVDSQFFPATSEAQTNPEKMTAQKAPTSPKTLTPQKAQATPMPSTPEQPALTKEPEPIHTQGASTQYGNQGRVPQPQFHAPHSPCKDAPSGEDEASPVVEPNQMRQQPAPTVSSIFDDSAASVRQVARGNAQQDYARKRTQQTMDHQKQEREKAATVTGEQAPRRNINAAPGFMAGKKKQGP